MDIRNNDNRLNLNIFTPLISVIIGVLLIASIMTGYYISVHHGIIVFSLILCVVGISTTESWSKELDEDGYAAISHLYSGYFAAIFLFMSITPMLYLILETFIAIIVSIFISLFYASIISAVAFRRIDEEDRKNVIEPYKGPAIIYDINGPYIEHVEQVAFEDRD